MLKISKVSFPGFHIGEFDLNSVAFTIFGKEVAWYGLVITLGIVFCFFYVAWRTRSLGLVMDDVIDIGVPTVIIAIIGARAYYVLTSLDAYRGDFWSIFAIWEGGLAIYGALITGGITVFFMCRYKKVKFSAFADCTCPSILVAQAVGRLGNFFNGEAFGSQTEIFSRMGLQNDLTFFKFGTHEMVYVHPTFLYESLWNLIGFGIATALFSKRKYNGFIFHFCFAWYGFGRMFIELLRTDSLYIPGLPQMWFAKISTVVGFVCFVVFTSLIVYNLLRYNKASEEEKKAILPSPISREEYEAVWNEYKEKRAEKKASRQSRKE